MKQEGFKHIGQTAATGMQRSLSEAGSNAGQTAVAASQAATQAAVSWLVQRSPAQTDEAILLRLSSLSAGVTVRAVEGLPIVIRVSGDMTARREAANAIAGFFSPAPERTIEGWIAELSVITRRAKDDEMTERLRLSAFAKRLAKYPADIAQEALLVHKWLFFPAWAELQDVCDKLVAARAAVLWHLRNAPLEKEPETRDLPSLERRQQMVAEAQRIFSGFGGEADGRD